MSIDRRTLFLEAWKTARRIVGQFRTLRIAFSAALRRTWALAKEMVHAIAVEKAHRHTPKPASVARSWADENPCRAAAVAARKARLGNYCLSGW